MLDKIIIHRAYPLFVSIILHRIWIQQIRRWDFIYILDRLAANPEKAPSNRQNPNWWERFIVRFRWLLCNRRPFFKESGSLAEIKPRIHVPVSSDTFLIRFVSCPRLLRLYWFNHTLPIIPQNWPPFGRFLRFYQLPYLIYLLYLSFLIWVGRRKSCCFYSSIPS